MCERYCKCVWRDVTTPMNVALMQFPYERTICQQQALVYNITNIWLCSIYSFGWQRKTIFQRNLCLLWNLTNLSMYNSVKIMTSSFYVESDYHRNVTIYNIRFWLYIQDIDKELIFIFQFHNKKYSMSVNYHIIEVLQKENMI